MSNSSTSIDECRRNFGYHLKKLRKQRNLSQGDLKASSGVADSLISAFEHGDRAVGAEVATRLADALSLEGDERESFLLSAASTRRRDRLVEYARQLPPEIINYLPRVLSEAGVDLEAIECSDICHAKDTGDKGLQRCLENEFKRVLWAVQGLDNMPFVQFMSGDKKYVGTFLLVRVV